MTDEPTPEAPRETPTPEEARKRTYWRLGRAAIMGLLIGAVVIIFSHLAR